ncbi:transporter [Pelomonas sp. KK5]|uniref:transporter n=1 Tax=Pelomonas sp. KK5 TaxID=1855730 RepID=UPI00097BA826|nr:transporter [Pelomonas sp. KK5]
MNRPLPALLLCLAASTAQAQQPLTTDRPDFSESPEVVGRGRFQIETSIAFERDRREATRTRSTPTLLRLGLNDSWELRLETDGLMRQRDTSTGQVVSGASDPSLGLKWHLQDGEEDEGRPSIALLFHVDADTGSPAFRGQGLRPSLRMVSEWEFDGGWSLGVMPGIVWDRNEERRFASGLLALALSKQLTPTLSLTTELGVRRIASGRNGGNVYTFDPALAWVVTDDVQLDFGIDFGLNRRAPDRTVALGLSVRF